MATSDMAPNLYGTVQSPPVRTVLMVADILGIKLNFKELNPLTRYQDTPEMSKKNPMRTVPTFEENKFYLGDSHAIAIYLIDKYAKVEHQYLLPNDKQKRATVYQRLFFDCGVIFPRLRSIMAPTYGGVLTEPKKSQLRNIEDIYRSLEEYLSQTTFLACDHITVADVCVASTISSLHGLHPIDAKRFPKLKQWLIKMSKYDFYRKHNEAHCKEHVAVLKQLMQNNKERAKL